MGDHLRPDEISRLLEISVYSFGSVATRVAFYETIAKSFSALNSIIGIEVHPFIVQYDESNEATNAFVAEKIPNSIFIGNELPRVMMGARDSQSFFLLSRIAHEFGHIIQARESQLGCSSAFREAQADFIAGMLLHQFRESNFRLNYRRDEFFVRMESFPDNICVALPDQAPDLSRDEIESEYDQEGGPVIIRYRDRSNKVRSFQLPTRPSFFNFQGYDNKQDSNKFIDDAGKATTYTELLSALRDEVANQALDGPDFQCFPSIEDIEISPIFLAQIATQWRRFPGGEIYGDQEVRVRTILEGWKAGAGSFAASEALELSRHFLEGSQIATCNS